VKFWILFCALFALPIYAATHTVPPEEPLVSVDVPDQWQTKQLGDVFHATAPKEPLNVLVVPPEGTKIAETMGEVMRYIRNSGGIVVKPESRRNETAKLNGIDVKQATWEGTDKNGDIKIQFTILPLAERKSVLLACWGSLKAEQKHEAELKKIFESIKPADEGAEMRGQESDAGERKSESHK
jgi:hypothetical protein